MNILNTSLEKNSMDTFQKSKRELKKLATWYKNVTVGRLKKKWNTDGDLTLKVLIGFGRQSTCKVCLGQIDCKLCIWTKLLTQEELKKHSCVYCIDDSTYYNLQHAESPRELKRACTARAKYIEKLLKKYEKNNAKI